MQTLIKFCFSLFILLITGCTEKHQELKLDGHTFAKQPRFLYVHSFVFIPPATYATPNPSLLKELNLLPATILQQWIHDCFQLKGKKGYLSLSLLDSQFVKKNTPPLKAKKSEYTLNLLLLLEGKNLTTTPLSPVKIKIKTTRIASKRLSLTHKRLLYTSLVEAALDKLDCILITTPQFKAYTSKS